MRLPLLSLVIASIALACNGDTPPEPIDTPPPTGPATLSVTGRGPINTRFTAEVWVRGTTAYTTTWGTRGASQVSGNAVFVWDVSGATPVLVDSAIVATDATTLGDVQTSDDGKLLIVPTEGAPGSIVIFDLTTPRKPQQIARFTDSRITRGVHTTEVQRVSGTLYAFLAVNRGAAHPAGLMIVDLSNPQQPTVVTFMAIGNPFVHDVFVRDGLLFTAEWSSGLAIYDIGGGGAGGTVRAPVRLGGLVTVGGNVHNAWWYHDGQTGDRKYVFVGEEGPGSIGASSRGDIHVVDISNRAAPREVAVFSVLNAGTHNFSVDEENGILYAAYYNGGVQALDVRGDLSQCTTVARRLDGRCDLGLMGRLRAVGALNQGMPVYVWGVHYQNGFVYASDMLNGLWKFRAVTR